MATVIELRSRPGRITDPGALVRAARGPAPREAFASALSSLLGWQVKPGMIKAWESGVQAPHDVLAVCETAAGHGAIPVEFRALPDAGQHGEPGLVPPVPATTEEMLTLAADRARRFALLTGQTSLSDETLDQIYADVRRLVWAYPQRPLTEILNDLVLAQDTVFSLLETRQRPAHAQQLYLLGGIVGGLLAKASHDTADPHAALAQSRAAYLCAEQADHNGLRAWIRGLQALITYWDGRLHESVRYAQAGAQLAGRSNNTAMVWLPVSEARAWAALGNAHAARRAIERAERSWETVQGDELDELGGICTFSRARQLYYSADALAWLPSESASAQEYAGQAIAAYEDTSAPEWAFGDAAGSRCDLAVARIAAGEAEGARDAIAPVLEIPPEQRIRGIISSVQRVHAALRRPELAETGRDLQEEIEVFAKTPLKALSV